MIYISIILVAAAVDLFFKKKIEEQKPENFPRALARTKENILLYRNHNAGFPFGFLEKHKELVRIVPLAVTSALAGVLCYLIPQPGKLMEKFSLSMIIGGSLSNLYDRWTRRYVVDYFSIQWRWLKRVVLNLGDLCVFIGTIILLVREIVKEFRGGIG